MISKKTQNILMGIGLLITLVMAFFPTSSFLTESKAVVMSQLKQQPYNEVGLYEISPLRAAEFYYYQSSSCLWIDLRDGQQYTVEHLSFADNMDMNTIEQTDWPAGQVLLLFGKNTIDAVQAVAELRQLYNLRAFAVQGGFAAVKNELVNPLTLELSSKLSVQQMEQINEYRQAIAGQIIRGGKTTQQVVRSAPIKRKVKQKTETVDEGC